MVSLWFRPDFAPVSLAITRDSSGTRRVVCSQHQLERVWITIVTTRPGSTGSIAGR